MKRIVLLLAGAMVCGVIAFRAPAGYRDWKLISVTHEEGDFDQLRAQLGNDGAMQAFRKGTLPFPDGAIIVALHWKRVPSDRDNKVFGRVQAFVAGHESVCSLVLHRLGRPAGG